MADFDYAPLLTTAKQLLDDFGRPVGFRQLTDLPTTGDTPWRNATRPGTSHAQRAVNLPATSGLGFVSDDSDLVRLSSALFLVAPSDVFDFLHVDEIEDNGTTYKVTKVERLMPGDTALLFVIGAKQ